MEPVSGTAQDKAKRPGFLVVLTGAGISAESGIPTFRSNGGLWRTYRFDELASPAAFERNPNLVWEFYRWRQETARRAQPNRGHEVLAAMEKALGERMLLVTQNVDDLHERAGSRRLLHLHGALSRARCTRCNQVHEGFDYQESNLPCPRCGETRSLRPHIVWFGEQPFYLEEINDALLRATLFIAIGTSGVVYPAAQFVNVARRHGAYSLLINLDSADNSSAFHQLLPGKSSLLLEELWRAMGNKPSVERLSQVILQRGTA